MTRLTTWVAVGVLLAACAGASRSSATAPSSAPPFRAAVEAHLSAVARRDMDALLPTLTGGHELTMIAPDGHKFSTRREYVDFHRQWFAAKDDGKFEIEIIRTIESPALGHALVKYRYSSKDESGTPRATVAWLALTFALENGSWRLVFDQNTLIAAPPAPSRQ